jgi:hypothetical protein
MKVTNIFRKMTVAAGLLPALLVGGCGGGGGAAAPQGTTVTGVTTGAITGFGSVIVNGVKFSRKTGLAEDVIKLPLDNLTGEDKLRAGMTVRIKGTFNSTTGVGEYTEIEHLPELQGRLDDNGVDTINDRIKVMGRTVQIEASTVFDSVRDLAELAADLGNGNHPEIEISGNVDNSGVLHATRVFKKALDFNAATGVVEAKGAIATAVGNTITITGLSGITIDTTGATFVNMLANQVAVGLTVEVRGTFDPNTSTITATRIEKKGAAGELNDNVRVKGVVGTVDANAKTFTISSPNGPVSVVTDSSTAFLNNKAATTFAAIVAAGATLEVEGSVNAGGAIVATKVSVEAEKTVKLEGDVTAKDANALTLTVNGVTVKTLQVTKILDAGGAAVAFAAITVGEHIQVTAFVDATGQVVAAQVQDFTGSNKTLIQGPVSAKGTTTLTILGVTVTPGGSAEFRNADRSPIGTLAAFLGKIVPNVTVVKATGTFVAPSSFTATELEFEQQQ